MDKDVQTVSLGTYEQVKWERDLAISQLASYGISLGENADVISRSAVLNHKMRMTEYDETGCGMPVFVVKVEDIENLPSMNSKSEHSGQWVWDDNAIDWNIGAWVCSKCKSRNDNIYACKPDFDANSMTKPFLTKIADEIKRGLEECTLGDGRECDVCPFHDYEHCDYVLEMNALEYIQKLEKERNTLLADIREMDVDYCNRCAHYVTARAQDKCDGYCWGCDCEDCPCNTCWKNSNWKRRGVEVE